MSKVFLKMFLLAGFLIFELGIGVVGSTSLTGNDLIFVILIVSVGFIEIAVHEFFRFRDHHETLTRFIFFELKIVGFELTLTAVFHIKIFETIAGLRL